MKLVPKHYFLSGYCDLQAFKLLGCQIVRPGGMLGDHASMHFLEGDSVSDSYIRKKYIMHRQ